MKQRYLPLSFVSVCDKTNCATLQTEEGGRPAGCLGGNKECESRKLFGIGCKLLRLYLRQFW